MDDVAIQELVARLARAHASGGHVIERAAIIAEGADSQAVITWIIAHGGIPEAAEATSRRHGLHGALRHAGGGSAARNPSRFILPRQHVWLTRRLTGPGEPLRRRRSRLHSPSAPRPRMRP